MSCDGLTLLKGQWDADLALKGNPMRVEKR
jgi:hypothetical protein